MVKLLFSFFSKLFLAKNKELQTYDWSGTNLLNAFKYRKKITYFCIDLAG